MKRRVYRTSSALALLAAVIAVLLLLTDNPVRAWLSQVFSEWPQWARWLAAVLGGYFIGSIPFGYLIIGVLRERDIRDEGSGRTGGTNAFRSGGFGAGMFTIIADILKGIVAVLFGAIIFPGNIWVLIFAGWGAVLGHNASVFLAFKGGAGAMTNIGVAVAFWPPLVLLIAPLFVLGMFVIRVASLSSLIFGVTIIVVFAVRAMLGQGPWEFVIYAVGGFLLVAYALRPNIKRLFKGTEPRVPRVTLKRSSEDG